MSVIWMFQSWRETQAFPASQAAPINHTASTNYSATVAIYHRGQLSAPILWGWENALDFCYYPCLKNTTVKNKIILVWL